MTNNDSPRILIPIDPHGISRETLETLVRIARQMNRGLLGLLLDDIRLQQAAALPFTTEITFSGTRERSLLRDHLSQRTSRVTLDTRHTLLGLAELNRVDLKFEEAPGLRLHTVLERDGHLDVFFPSRRRWHLLAPGPARGRAAIRRLGLLLGCGPDTARVVDAARLLIDADLVDESYVLAEGNLPPEQLAALSHPGHRLRIQCGARCDAAAITGLIQQSPYDLLLLPRSALQQIPTETLDAILDKSGSQVLVVN